MIIVAGVLTVDPHEQRDALLNIQVNEWAVVDTPRKREDK